MTICSLSKIHKVLKLLNDMKMNIPIKDDKGPEELFLLKEDTNLANVDNRHILKMPHL